MNTTSLRFLHAADLHLDSPLRGLARYEGAPLDRLRGATRRALERLVDLALAERVALVVLAGDIYDRDWQDFHTGLFFREQMVRLGRAGVQVFVAQGNHDAQGVISRQLELPPHVRVFSSRTAQSFVLRELGVALHGRSFPEREVPEDLVPHYPAPVPGLFNIGVLHTSLTGSAAHDTYAPTSLAALQAKAYDYWALGHVHARQVVCEAGPRVVFPGNLQGRHANECGPKGCELVTVDGAGRVSAEFVALDVVRWSQLELPLDGVGTLAAFQAAAREAFARLHSEAPDRLHAVRLKLSGATPLRTLEARAPGTLEAAAQAAAQDVEGEIWLERVQAALHEPLDRQAVAARADAVGELARLVDELCADPQQLPGWARQALGELLHTLPPEVRAADDGRIPDLDDAAALRALLLDAEATVLARLAGAPEERP